ncbi:multisubunit potassium/proton antiporter PhaE subunit [Tamilnaduibacter salinus]|uniref:Multisubunit potassium/proton antiporter PhaE subunit n=1 Tax=Tamilnaduibacter salinus TaxID=1484056 RepID=A0A2A2I421_9GAMM|nr:Na+/H+ antiporter subunit E [Tamilnaduibacter salinus]PAV25783.1 Na+/H+ antiporter subunit E [Tamilnaduibacter salinus]PVY75764.1 multisubunit potassium/proton antiporter PhaE subunit [Tamilnaduibacter salinus]
MNARFGLPHPLLSFALFFVWLMLAGASAGYVVLGLLLAWILPLVTRGFWPDTPRIKKPWKLLPYTLKVILDIIIASLTVARLVLSFRRKPQPAFVCYPLTLTDPMGITMLASTISLTPGTVSADVSDDHRVLLIHAVDVSDDQELIEDIHDRYEKALLEVFQ